MCVLWRYTQWKNKCSSRAMWCPLWVLMLTIILVEKLKQIKWTFCNPFHSIHHLMEYPFPAYCISVFSFYFVSVRYRNCIFYFCIQMLSAIMNWTMLHICYRSAVKAASSYFFLSRQTRRSTLSIFINQCAQSKWHYNLHVHPLGNGVLFAIQLNCWLSVECAFFRRIFSDSFHIWKFVI